MSQLKTNKGFSLIEIMVGVAIVSILALGFAQIASQMHASNARTNLTANLQNLRQQHYAILDNTAAFTNTLSDPLNTTFQCFQKLTDCKATPDEERRNFSIRDAGNSIYFDGVNPQAGFNSNGTPCTAFPSPACSLRLDLTWRPICPPDKPCLVPQVEITGKMIYSTGPGSLPAPFNPENYKFVLVRTLSSTSQAQGEETQENIDQICQMLQTAADPAALVQLMKQQMKDRKMEDAIPMIDNLAKTCVKK